MTSLIRHLLLGVLLCTTPLATRAADTAAPATSRKVGVLLVNHGSRSATWRQALLDLEARVRPALLDRGAIQGVKTAFMEYTEPSIATRLKEFDADGFTDVVIVPLFLTVSAHTFDDIPTIIGKKVDPSSLEMMRLEKIERYAPKAAVALTPNLDFPDILKENVLRRARALSQQPAEESLVLIAYGDETYDKEWTSLLDGVGDYVQARTGIPTHTHGWCGHIVRYSSAKTTEAIERALQSSRRALVIPVLVAHDENFQIKIIGGGIAKVPDHQTRVVYKPDAILPEPLVDQWVVAIAHRYAAALAAGQSAPIAAHP